MIKPLKIAVITLIISGGLLGSYWIIKDAKQTTGETAGFSFEEAIKPGGTLFKYVEETVQEIKENIENKTTNYLELNNQIPKNSSANLTEIIAQIVAGKILEENKGGFAKTEEGEPKLSMPDDETLIQELTDQLTNLDTNLLNLGQPISETNLKISQNNSQEAQIKYIENIQQITKTNFDKLNGKSALDILSATPITGNVSSLENLVDVYKSTINDYFKLETPSNWLNFHKQAITYFQNASTIYQTLADFQNDPVKAYLAFGMVEQLINNAESIQDLLNQKIKKIR